VGDSGDVLIGDSFIGGVCLMKAGLRRSIETISELESVSFNLKQRSNL
jgi:hypothetical protein